MENVIALTFSGTDQAGEALRALRLLHDQGDIQLDAVAVVERTEEGRTVVLEEADDVQVKATATGGVLGAIIGLLGGPFGLVVGGATGAAVGALVDIADAESSDDVLRSWGRTVPPGHAATIAVIVETTPLAVDAMASALGVNVFRRSRAEVELEIAAAEEAAIASERDADISRTIPDRLRDLKDALVDRR